MRRCGAPMAGRSRVLKRAGQGMAHSSTLSSIGGHIGQDPTGRGSSVRVRRRRSRDRDDAEPSGRADGDIAAVADPLNNHLEEFKGLDAGVVMVTVEYW